MFFAQQPTNVGEEEAPKQKTRRIFLEPIRISGFAGSTSANSEKKYNYLVALCGSASVSEYLW